MTCTEGHATTPWEKGQHRLPCGCTLETATPEAWAFEFSAPQRALHTWEGHPKRDQYLAANDGAGMCNTGSGLKGMCALGGVGCNVDHLTIDRSETIGAPA